MKIVAKKKFQVLLDYIEFPAMVYVNETGRIIAVNSLGKGMIGSDCKSINEIFDNDLRLQFRRRILDVGGSIFHNVFLSQGECVSEIDIEVNSIEVDARHLVICFFDYSYKQVFVKNLSKQVPRIFYKNCDLEFLSGNHFFVFDTKIDLKGCTKNEHVFDEETCVYLNQLEKEIIESQEGDFNCYFNGKIRGKQICFIRINRIPVIDKDDKTVGILGVYNMILSRTEFRGIFDATLRENQILNRVIGKLGMYILNVEMVEGWPISYISPNFSQLSYVRYNLFDGKIYWKDIALSEDFEKISKEYLKRMEEGTGTYPLLQYRIRDFSGNYIWVEDETYNMEKRGKSWYRECLIKLLPDKK